MRVELTTDLPYKEGIAIQKKIREIAPEAEVKITFVVKVSK